MAQGKDVRAAAKVLYEAGTQTIKQIAAEIGTSSRTVERWARADGWQRMKPTPELTERAHRVASKLAATPENTSPEERQQALVDATEDEAVMQRGEVINRHRAEWRVVRLIANEAARDRNGDRAKLAVGLARATKLSQDGERRAWGIHAGPDGQNRIQVIIERE